MESTNLSETNKYPISIKIIFLLYLLWCIPVGWTISESIAHSRGEGAGLVILLLVLILSIIALALGFVGRTFTLKNKEMLSSNQYKISLYLYRFFLSIFPFLVIGYGTLIVLAIFHII